MMLTLTYKCMTDPSSPPSSPPSKPKDVVDISSATLMFIESLISAHSTTLLRDSSTTPAVSCSPFINHQPPVVAVNSSSPMFYPQSFITLQKIPKAISTYVMERSDTISSTTAMSNRLRAYIAATVISQNNDPSTHYLDQRLVANAFDSLLVFLQMDSKCSDDVPNAPDSCKDLILSVSKIGKATTTLADIFHNPSPSSSSSYLAHIFAGVFTSKSEGAYDQISNPDRCPLLATSNCSYLITSIQNIVVASFASKNTSQSSARTEFRRSMDRNSGHTVKSKAEVASDGINILADLFSLHGATVLRKCCRQVLVANDGDAFEVRTILSLVEHFEKKVRRSDERSNEPPLLPTQLPLLAIQTFFADRTPCCLHSLFQKTFPKHCGLQPLLPGISSQRPHHFPS